MHGFLLNRKKTACKKKIIQVIWRILHKQIQGELNVSLKMLHVIGQEGGLTENNGLQVKSTLRVILKDQKT